MFDVGFSWGKQWKDRFGSLRGNIPAVDSTRAENFCIDYSADRTSYLSERIRSKVAVARKLRVPSTLQAWFLHERITERQIRYQIHQLFIGEQLFLDTKPESRWYKSYTPLPSIYPLTDLQLMLSTLSSRCDLSPCLRFLILPKNSSSLQLRRSALWRLALSSLPAAPAESRPGSCRDGAPLGPAWRVYGTREPLTRRGHGVKGQEPQQITAPSLQTPRYLI